MLAVFGIFFLSYAVMTLVLIRDPWLIKTPFWVELLLAAFVYGSGLLCCIIFFAGAVICHGAC